MLVYSMHNDLAQILVDEQAIHERIASLGREIDKMYNRLGVDELTVIAITNGAILFAADLVRAISGPYVRLDTVRVSSYKDEDKPVCEPEIVDSIRLDISDAHVLLIDDILDTGRTLQKIVKIMKGFRPASLRTCVLLNKEGRRRSTMKADFVGFDIPDHFVVGYGLDFAERYRNLPYIGVLKPEMQNPPSWQ